MPEIIRCQKRCLAHCCARRRRTGVRRCARGGTIGGRTSRGERRRPRFEQPMLTIRQRPFLPADRSEAGHWETS
jgi:IS30 family transposase